MGNIIKRILLIVYVLIVSICFFPILLTLPFAWIIKGEAGTASIERILMFMFSDRIMGVLDV